MIRQLTYNLKNIINLTISFIQQMQRVLILFLLFCTYIYSQCPINYQLSNLTAGSTTFITTSSINPSNHLESFVYSFPSTYQSTPSSVIAINSFDIEAAQIVNMGFNLTITAITNFNMNFSFIYNTKAITLLQVNFLVGKRADLILGYSSYVVSNNEFTIPTSTAVLSSLNSTIARVFINGFQLKQNISTLYQFNISLIVTTVSKQYLTLYINGFSLSLVQKVWFSYIVFSPSQASFASYGGSISQSSFSGNQLYNLNSIFYQSSYKVFGISSLTLSHNSSVAISSWPIQFSLQIDNNFVGSLISSSTQINYINLDYIIIGVTPQSYCSSCPAFQYAMDSQCISVCPSNAYVRPYQYGGKACLTCNQRLNQQLNSNKNGCQCKNGRKLDQNGNCVIIQSNTGQYTPQTILISSQPLIQSNTQSSTNQTVNVANIVTTLTYSSQTCALITNAYWTGFSCVCQPGYSNISDNCIKSTNNVNNFLPLPLWMMSASQNSAFSWNMYGAKVNGNGKTNINNTNNNNGNNNTNTVVQNPCEVNQYLFNGVCSCNQNYVLIQGICQLSNSTLNCPQNSFWNGSQCVCNNGYLMANNICQSNQNGCPANSINNGLGYCICQQGFYNISGSCQAIQPCPLNSIRQSNGSCLCNQGYTNISNYCLQCQPGQYYDQVNSICVQNCGVNAFYNNITKACQCITNYGIKSGGICGLCLGPQYIIMNNYCVSCPLNQEYNSITLSCQCVNGYYMSSSGGCLYKCANNQVYDPSTSQCNCVSGLGRTNGVCQICTNSTSVDPMTQNCMQCPLNSYYTNGACQCQTGYVLIANSQCLPCNLIPNSFIINGSCATCPGQKVFNGFTCTCPMGTTVFGLQCVNNCLNDEYIDQNGNCFICPSNQYYVNGTCKCKTNYQMTGGVCQLICSAGQFEYRGRCAMCPMNLQYNALINGCACPTGYYLTNNMQCMLFVGSPVQCPSSQYLDPALGCRVCTISNCITCSSSKNCSQCAVGYKNINGSCINYCGDGIISQNQQCDDGNIFNNDGCSSVCTVQQNYICAGQPSACRYTGPIINTCGNGIIQTNQTCDDGNTRNGDGCSSTCIIQAGYSCSGQPSVCTPKLNSSGLNLFSPIQTNINNVLVTLQTTPTFTFSNEADMQSFMKSSFTSPAQPTTYCIQRASPNLDIFDCLLIYPSGVPISTFNATFWYNYQTKIGNATVSINPLVNNSPTRSIR